MPGTWQDAGRIQRQLADIDASCDGDPQPRLVGFQNDQPLTFVVLRPFSKGAALGPLVEALAFALPFGATQISLSMPSRAWSMQDPIPPVVDGVDLRQRVLTELRVEADQPVTSHLHPFDVEDGSITWGKTRNLGAPEGQLARTLAIATSSSHDWDSDPYDVLDQLARLGSRGHEVAFAPRGQRRLLELLDELERID